MQRSRFLLGALGGLTVIGSTGSIFSRALAQAPLGGLPGRSADRVLVVINFQGGNDGLNTVVPHGQGSYYRYRPTLGIAPNDVLQIDKTIGFNPVLRPLKSLYDAGKVAIVQNVGYPKPDHSHFRSTEIWQTAAPDTYEHTGWLGRHLDTAGLDEHNLFNGVALAQVLPEALISRKIDVPAIAQLGGYGLSSDKTAANRAAFGSIISDANVPFTSPYLSAVAEIEDHAQRGSQELPQLIAGYTSSANYPATQLGRSLALAAQIIGSRLGTRVLYIQHGSFDTHVAQKGVQDRLLAEFAHAIEAFSTDLAAHGNDKRVLTMTFSEFGRRVGENASRGTDHGTAAPLFLIGGGVVGGTYGDYPSLDNLDAGDLRHSVDFRSVYTTVLEKWFERSASGVIAGTFPMVAALG